jgi:hypothetical protein
MFTINAVRLKDESFTLDTRVEYVVISYMVMSVKHKPSSD